MGELFRRLKENAQSDFYPYHMPGHKRSLGSGDMRGLIPYDITEIDEFDNLHDAGGILLNLQKKAAVYFHAEESFYLINGSTCGILSAVSAAVREGGHLLMTRGCHRSAYHAAYLRKLKVSYLWQEEDAEFGCSLPLEPIQVKEALKKDPSIEAVLVVSPTYEGVVSDIGMIARVVHESGRILIVDEAHGAHLGFHPAWPKNSCQLGADLVVQSLHKTLPSPTQTAVLHVCGNRVDRERLKRFLRIYQSSSPSYPLMAAMEDGIELAARNGGELFDILYQNWQQMMDALKQCRCLRFLQVPGMDIGKLVIKDGSGQLSGREVYDRLRQDYHLQPEMAAGRYCLAMFTIGDVRKAGDTKEGLERMQKALLELDGQLADRKKETTAEKKTEALAARPLRPKRLCSLQEAWDAPYEEILLADSVGRTAAEFINLYPPGVPLIVPGEQFSARLCARIAGEAKLGLTVQGIRTDGEKIWVKTCSPVMHVIEVE